MPTEPRLFVEDPHDPIALGQRFSLSSDQTHYLRCVLRLQQGDNVRVFSESEGEWLAQIDSISKSLTQLRVLHAIHPPQRLEGPTLVIALLKRDAMDLSVRMGTELGVARFALVITERTNTHRTNLARLRSIGIEAAEQCERLTIPHFETPLPLATALTRWPQHLPLFAALERHRVARPENVPRDFGLLIGPEGGFSLGEVTRLKDLPFVCPLTLGDTILRADTAVAAGLAHLALAR